RDVAFVVQHPGLDEALALSPHGLLVGEVPRDQPVLGELAVASEHAHEVDPPPRLGGPGLTVGQRPHAVEERPRRRLGFLAALLTWRVRGSLTTRSRSISRSSRMTSNTAGPAVIASSRCTAATASRVFATSSTAIAGSACSGSAGPAGSDPASAPGGSGWSGTNLRWTIVCSASPISGSN